MSALARLHLERLRAPENPRSGDQEQTQEAFGFKWAKRHTYESEAVQRAAQTWLFDRYCGGDATQLDQWLDPASGRRLILDAGCGAGHSALLFFGQRLRDHDYLGVDLSAAVDVGRQRFQEQGLPGDFLRCDLMDLPVPDDTFDLIFSEGVLHHTDSTERAIKALAKKLKPGGRFLFYVYAKKAPIREFTDDLIREHLRPLPDAEAWEALQGLTQLGMALGQMEAEIDIPADIPILGIRKGRMDLQRFFYWHICKAYFRPDWSQDEMNHVNFDWFRPLNCHRQTPEQVEAWTCEAGLFPARVAVEEAGITMVAEKRL
ncbi:class I SAM-dependent methyltransferase [Geothrix sp. PMB-07]|uniref:class I SAM-dependent methyltransferase n=1 Tax=Geothrix sp. PMB-07 TaxID=3068640 RepID=UPI0027403D76|nr:class I SAM-dependent methyltransferase [Geothrix sp. PMB-07]WLT31796.1 class I SAM-dependent methyltransferase [Geothrix sp. PMB-07]